MSTTSNPHELQGVGVHDVEAAASVHEHLGEASVADDGVDNERVTSRMRDVVGVVLAAKGDGILRLVEVGWRGFGDGKDFAALTLALPRSHIRHCSSKDEEGVLHWGELVISTGGNSSSPPLSPASFFLSSSRCATRL